MVPLSDAIFHSDPFYAECRAYGRIKEAQKQELAVPCHGYLFLQERDTQILREKGVDLDEALIDKLLQVNGGDTRVRAIVKDFVPGDAGVNAGSVCGILGDIRALNQLGIYIGDVRADNFKAGKCVDFGLSLTEPHWKMELSDEETRWHMEVVDLVRFDEMVKNEGLVTSVRGMPNSSELQSWSRSKHS